MEVVVGVEGSEEGKIEDNASDKPTTGSAPLKEAADPVVYKLVRVDFDGRLVPATDDEFMEVENLMELEPLEGSELVYMSDIANSVGQDMGKDDTSKQPLLNKYKGLLENKNAEVADKKLEVHREKSLATSATKLKNECVNQTENTGQESGLEDGLSKKGSASSLPDFSWLKGEINLDKLTIRELQETFRATFGRKTSVKDKVWLKRRIAMGLTNSCDVPVTSFIIRDGKFLKKEEMGKNGDCEDPVAGEIMCGGNDKLVVCQNMVKDELVACKNAIKDTVVSAELGNFVMESGHGSDDDIEQKGKKRVRKPTKRYIEESDKETKDTSGKLIPAAKRSELHKVSLRLPVRTVWSSQANSIVTRPDSIGGTGIQVPYVSRIRRCRPRKNIMAFMASPLTLTRKAAENSVTVTVSNALPDDLGGNKVGKIKSVLFKTPIASEEEKEKHCSTGTSDVSQDKEPTDTDSRDSSSQENATGINSDDNVATVPTVKGGMRRKHHRAWTLTEVVKLVDGVSKFGAGRWSEIKRLSFSSCPYRTSVDLKDKWRNLLKASFSNSPLEKGVNPRKNAPSPVPAPILVKVRELAEINGQAPQIFKTRSEINGSSVNEYRSGYL